MNKASTISIVNDLLFDVIWMEVNTLKRKAQFKLKEM